MMAPMPANYFPMVQPVAAPVPVLTLSPQLESAKAFLRMAGFPKSELQGDLPTLTNLIRNLRQA